VPRVCEVYSAICLTNEEKARKNLSQGSRRMPVGTMETEYTEQNIHNNKNTQLTELNKCIQNIQPHMHNKNVGYQYRLLSRAVNTL